MSALFEPLRLREVELANRVWVSPMCQYSAGSDGRATDWHLVHLGSLARGGASLVLCEATAVLAEGRITAGDLGLWSDEQIAPLRRCAAFVAEQGAVPGIQLGHAGRKASVEPPWRGNGRVDAAGGGWTPVAPSAVPFADGWHVPTALDEAGIERVVEAFAAAARRSVTAGFRVLELHAAHGYLLHEFLSPLSNRRTDRWGGDLDGRLALPLAVAAAVREEWPAELPLLVRVSATDWVEGGWDLPSTVELARRLRALGVDLVDCSSGGLSPDQQIALGPGYQVPFAEAVRREAGVPTGAVGLITEPAQAEEIVASGKADAVLLARELLRAPHWPLLAAHALGADVRWPLQYERARPA